MFARRAEGGRAGDRRLASARADAAALASQVHPVFMLPPLAASAFGAVLAGRFAPRPAILHLLAVFLALYTAHVKDGYVDFHRRGEDEDHPMTAPGCRRALAAASLGFLSCLAGIVALVGPVAGLITLPGWLIGIGHAPQLDTNPVTATTGYPTGVALALLGGYYLQVGRVAPVVVAFAVVFLAVLSGIKVIDDATDCEYDRSIGKRTVAVALGPERAGRVAYALMLAGMGAVGGGALVGAFPPGAILAAAAFLVVAAIASRAPPDLATKLLVRGSYLFLALLVAAVWFRPLG